ncbi:MAG TPA: BMC domain-containing protein [Candidatus Mediterraneibacter colneyensis]|nr:BMC domain-containing protein [Candidatus Mediterraneibacter colneyensis]
MTYGAYGLVEVVGEANAVLVTDRMLKTAEVEYVTQDTKCGGHALVFIGGSVSAVTSAVDSVKEDPPCEVVETAVISNPSQEMVDIVEEFCRRRKK